MSIALAQLFFSGTLTQTYRKSPLFFVKFGTAIFWRIQCSTPQRWWFVQEDKHRMWSARSWLHIDLACELFCNSSQQCHVIGPTSSFLGCYLPGTLQERTRGPIDDWMLLVLIQFSRLSDFTNANSCSYPGCRPRNPWGTAHNVMPLSPSWNDLPRHHWHHKHYTHKPNYYCWFSFVILCDRLTITFFWSKESYEILLGMWHETTRPLQGQPCSCTRNCLDFYEHNAVA